MYIVENNGELIVGFWERRVYECVLEERKEEMNIG